MEGFGIGACLVTSALLLGVLVQGVYHENRRAKAEMVSRTKRSASGNPGLTWSDLRVAQKDPWAEMTADRDGVSFEAATSTVVLTRRGPQVAHVMNYVVLPEFRDEQKASYRGDLQYNGRSVYRVVLSEELAEEAKRSSVAPYLRGGFKEEKELVLREVLVTGHAWDLQKGFSSLEKCEVILQWMCGGE